jgi:hypothetical protein
MKRIKQHIWTDLTPQEKNVLKRLNLYDFVKPKKQGLIVKTKVKAKVKTYVLLKTSLCLFCRRTSDEFFRMSPSEIRPCILEAKVITYNDILPTDSIREEKEFCFTCKHCKAFLEKESKEELIKRILILKGGAK